MNGEEYWFMQGGGLLHITKHWKNIKLMILNFIYAYMQVRKIKENIFTSKHIQTRQPAFHSRMFFRHILRHNIFSNGHSLL